MIFFYFFLVLVRLRSDCFQELRAAFIQGSESLTFQSKKSGSDITVGLRWCFGEDRHHLMTRYVVGDHQKISKKIGDGRAAAISAHLLGNTDKKPSLGEYLIISLNEMHAYLLRVGSEKSEIFDGQFFNYKKLMLTKLYIMCTLCKKLCV